jgi:hypothetical protein
LRSRYVLSAARLKVRRGPLRLALDAPSLGGNPLSQSLNFFLELGHLHSVPQIKGMLFGATQATRAWRYLVPEAGRVPLRARLITRQKFPTQASGLGILFAFALYPPPVLVVVKSRLSRLLKLSTLDREISLTTVTKIV